MIANDTHKLKPESKYLLVLIKVVYIMNKTFGVNELFIFELKANKHK